MYSTTLALHSLLRWIVLLMGLLAVSRAILGWTGRRPWATADDRASLFFTIALDVQLLAGLVLYFALSPLTQLAVANMGDAMRNPTMRFWAVEHPFGMVVALALAHVGRVSIRKAANDASRHKAAAMFFVVALVLVLLSSPWPWSTTARPLLRW